ncbi:MAG: type II toxin-antitoxin system VapC family toxin [Acidobacteriota bacterium]
MATTPILLDTHVWLWMNGAVERLSEPAREILAESEQELYLSAASTWEIAIKHAAGKLKLPQPPFRYIPSALAANNVKPLAIHQAHTWRAAALPLHHRDPFDRMLIAQAQAEGLQLMTADTRLEHYEVPILRADQTTL